MPDRFFLDTNVIVYSHDKSAPEKQLVAQALVKKALSGEGFISWQVIQEFCNVALKASTAPMDRITLEFYLDEFLFPLCGLFPSQEIFREALLVQAETGYHWYDSLIVASAHRLGCATLYSEDLQDGRTFRGVTIRNPFLG